MSAGRNKLLIDYAMPANSVFLEFPRSDGDAKNWPPNTTEVIDNMGQVNFYKPVGEDDGVSLKWKHMVAMKVSERLDMKEGYNYVFKRWPDGYRLFDHHKGNKESPRHDPYLIGSNRVGRFRSVPEFVPHAIWLMTDETMSRANCECKYCAKTPQREVSQRFGYTMSGSTPSLSQGPRPKRIRVTRDRAHPYAVVQKIKRPSLQVDPPKQVLVHERAADIDAVAMDLSPARPIRRLFRIGELIWCELSPHIRGREAVIKFWPGVVREHMTKVDSSPNGANGNDTSINIAPGEGVDGEDTEQPSFGIVQRTVYRVQLLGVQHEYLVYDYASLPYQGHATSTELLAVLRSVPTSKLILDRAEMVTFNPCPDGMASWSEEQHHNHFIAAAAPFSLALQAASGISTCWTPTDEFTYELAPISTANSVSSSSSSSPSKSRTYTAVEAAQHALSEVNCQLANPQLANGKSFEQTRYQGLWWGAERIWVNELVRLKPARKQIAPLGVANIRAPSGASDAFLAAQGLGPSASADDKVRYGASERGVFMRIHSLYAVDAVGPDNRDRSEILAGGTLYELADKDWEEQDGVPEGQTISPSEGDQPSMSTPPVPSTPRQMFSKGPAYMSPPQPQMTSKNPATSMNEENGSGSAASTSRPRRGRAKGMLASGSAANGKMSEAQMSGPSQGHDLPPPPPGYKFRALLTPGYEVVISLTLLGGRYYPGLLKHELLQPLREQMLLAAERNDFVPVEGESVLALEGVRCGDENAMDPTRWVPGRAQMVREAEKEALEALEGYWANSQSAGMGGSLADVAMSGPTGADPISDSVNAEHTDVEMEDLPPTE